MTLFLNPHFGTPGLVVLPAGGWRRAQAVLASWPGQAAGTLVEHAEWAGDLGVKRLAVYADVSSIGPIAFTYGARQAMVAALSRQGLGADQAAAITLASDDMGTVQQAAAVLGCQYSANPDGAEWVSVCATPGYTEIPREIMQAYRYLPERAHAQWSGAPPTHIVVPGGDGLLAAAVSVHLRPWAARLIVQEPLTDSPLLDHVMRKSGRVPGLLVWQELERGAFAYVAGPFTPHTQALGIGPESRVLVFMEPAAEPNLVQ